MKFINKPWESKILKLRVYSLEPQKINQLKLVDLDTLPRPNLVSVRISQSAVKQETQLKKLGFYLVENYYRYVSETRVLKELIIPTVVIKPIGMETAVACRRLAKLSFQYDRFHRDPNIKKNLADLSRVIWIENALAGRALFVLGSFINNKLIGFIDVNKKADKAVIDLLAVDFRYRKQHLASQLINSAKKILNSKQIHEIEVGTQAENIPAIACYIKNNFKLIAKLKTFHYHKA